MSNPMKILLVVADLSRARSIIKMRPHHDRIVVETDALAAQRRLRDGEWFDLVVSEAGMGPTVLPSAQAMHDQPPIIVLAGMDEMDGLSNLIGEMLQQRASARTRPLPLTLRAPGAHDV